MQEDFLMNRKLLVVLNPCSGKKKANRYFINIIALFNAKGCDCDVHVTGFAGDAAEYVRQNAGGHDMVVCIGGDGTLNEVITGLVSGGWDIPIGYIPSGSTNDFASSLGISKNIMEAARGILRGSPEPYDIGRFNNRYFSYVASFGAFTKVSYDTPQALKNSFGHFAYVMESIKELPDIKPIHAKITADGNTFEGDYVFGAISNSTSVAGTITLDPDVVDFGDGRLEVLLIKAPTTPTDWTNIAKAYTTKQYNNDTVKFFSAESIDIEISPDVDWTLDGEYEPGRDKVEIRTIMHAIRLIKK